MIAQLFAFKNCKRAKSHALHCALFYDYFYGTPIAQKRTGHYDVMLSNRTHLFGKPICSAFDVSKKYCLNLEDCPLL